MRPVHLIRVPYDSAARGARLGAGPDALCAVGLVERLQSVGHAVDEGAIEAPLGFHAEITTSFALLRTLAERVREAHAAGAIPFVLAGNCNTAVAMVGGIRADSADDLAVV